MSSKAKNREVGNAGEEIAANYLKRHGFTLLNRQYYKPWGELDIVAQNKNIVHFIEVKTLSYDSKTSLKQAVSSQSWRPEEQVHSRKLQQIHKALETWLSEKHYDGEWQIDVMAVRIVQAEKYATVKWLTNII